ncbi:MAG: SMK killer toxin resistance protein [Phylliscum demangeonii]|nr:MAG: SMK killer toxin resistance protein [Phylliscum demangeonii]
MATFLQDLMASIFTPGPTSSLVMATNAAFAFLQLLLGVLLYATRSVHFVVLSILCAGLWSAINWFVREMRSAPSAPPTDEGARPPPAHPSLIRHPDAELSGEDTETEREERRLLQVPTGRHPSAVASGVRTDADEAARRRRSLGDGAGDVSTEDEWERVSETSAQDR